MAGAGFGIRNVVIDCNDLDRMQSFWSAMTGFDIAHGDEAYVMLVHPDGRKPRLYLQKVPEPRVGKNRLHLDLDVDDLEGGTVHAESLGATRVQRFDTEGGSWMVMADPEGNVFCLSAFGG